MPEFIFAYHGGSKPESQEEGAKHMQEWKDWLGGLGDAVINPGTPVGMSKTVSSQGVVDNGGPDPLMGFSVVKADAIDGAIAMAQQCPFIHYDGRIEVAELKEM